MDSLPSILERFRRERQMTKSDLALAARVTTSYISQLTNREKRIKPSPETLSALASALQLPEADTSSLFLAAGYSLDFFQPPSAPIPRAPVSDLREAPMAEGIYGRDPEMKALSRWILKEHTHVVLIQGLGGMGKSALSAKFALSLKDDFEVVIWRSLSNAPRLDTILKDCIRLISRQKETELQGNSDEQIAQLMGYLQQYRCLIILDNLESLLQPGNAGQYEKEFEDYGRLIQQMGKLEHKSCFLLTSREKPREIALMEGISAQAPVRTLQLSGVEQDDAKKILNDKGITGSPQSWKDLVYRYSGNPLALKLIAQFILDAFDGNLDRFLQVEDRKNTGIAIGQDIDELVQEQFERLSDTEKSVLTWLAIEREAIPVESIAADFATPLPQNMLLDAISSLHRRSMIETGQPAHFTLQPVIMQFVSHAMVDHACQEFDQSLEEGHHTTWVNFAFVKAQSRDHVRDTQQRLIMEPIAQQLLFKLSKDEIKARLAQILVRLREHSAPTYGYLPGNILNFLIHLACDLRGMDFSQQVIRQAYLPNVSLPEVDFTEAEFIAPVFTNTFGNVLSIAFSPDSRSIAAGTATGDIWIYNLDDEQVRIKWQAHTDGVWSLLFNPDGKTLVSGSDDKTIRIWKVDSGTSFRSLDGHTNRVKSLALSPDARILASGSEDRTIRLWDYETGECLRTLSGHEDRIWSVSFSPDGHFLASGSTDHTIRLWDVDSGSLSSTIPDQEGWVLAVAFQPQGHLLASGGDDYQVHLWDIAANNKHYKTLSGHTKRVRALAFSPDGKVLASASEDTTIRLWDMKTFVCLSVLDGHKQGIRCLAYNNSGTSIVSGGDDQKISVWDSRKYYSLKTIHGYTSRIWSVVTARDTSTFASCSEDQVIRVWNSPHDRPDITLQDRTHGARAIAISASGDLLISGGEDRTLRKWDVRARRWTKKFEGHSGWIRCVALRPDGELLASGGEDHLINLWNLSQNTRLRRLHGHSNWIRSLAFSPDGRLLASGSDDTSIRLWNGTSGAPLAVFTGHTGHVRSIAFNPAGNILASGGEDKTVRLWDVASGEELGIFKGHTDRVLSVAFHRGGSLLASSSDDKTIYLWDLQTNSKRLLPGHENRVRWVTFDKDGLLLSCSDDGTIKFWNVNTGHSERFIRNERPYEGMVITHIRGLSNAQIEMLTDLGARE